MLETSLAPLAAGVAKPATQPRAHVIVADDDLVNQKVMRTYLERLGCDVRLASNGVEALTVLAAYPCDVLFLDIMMPRMDGTQTVREIRRHENEEHEAGHPVRRLPIDAITAKVPLPAPGGPRKIMFMCGRSITRFVR